MKVLLVLLILTSISYSNEKEKEYMQECTSSKEFITSYEYLKEEKNLRVPVHIAKKVAQKVALGCSGAAHRFISTTKIMAEVGVPGRVNLKLGMKMAQSEEVVWKSFISIFRYAYLEDGLDLSLKSSLKMAATLSIKLKGDHYKVREDFKELVSFCRSSEKISLLIGSCGKMAAEVASLGDKYEGDMSEAFVEAFEFLTESSRGPRLSLFDGIKAAQKVMLSGPMAAQNLEQAYRYASSKKGLGFNNKQSLEFAYKLVSLSQKKLEARMKPKGPSRSLASEKKDQSEDYLR
jgi:hypothetical protein